MSAEARAKRRGRLQEEEEREKTALLDSTLTGARSLTGTYDGSTSQSALGSYETQTSATFELAAVTPQATALSFSPSVVQIIDTTDWATPSADPAGLTYIPGRKTLLMSDSEADESPFFGTQNLFYLTATGQFDDSASLTSFCKEPTGVAFNPQNGHVFITDDSKKRVFEIDPDNPGVAISSFSTKTFGSDDAEDIIFDPVTGNLLISEGEQSSLHPRTLFEVTKSGQLVSSISLPAAVGDPEGIAYDAERQVFYISGHVSADIYVVSRDGQILDVIDILRDHPNPVSDTRVRAKGLTMAPSSNPNDDPSVMSLWACDYGKDQFMDGRLFEIQLAPSSSAPPLFTANADNVNFNNVVAGSYLAGTQYDALAGADTVVLPIDAAAASAAGYDPQNTFEAGDGNDTVTGGNLADEILGENGKDVLSGGGGHDQLKGGGGADKLTGGSGNDSLTAHGSNDTLIGGLGNDTLNGGSSNDTVDYSAAANAVSVNLATGVATGEGTDTLISIERATGSGFNDTIIGNGVANLLLGGNGGDTLDGSSGNDTLTGGAGTDSLSGGDGHDTLKWDSADRFNGGSGFDTLDAILSTADVIDLRDLDFSNLERIRTGSGKDVVTLSLNDVLSDTQDNQFIADLASSSPDTLNIDLSGGWTATTTNATLGPTAVAAGVSVSGMAAHTFTNGTNTVTVFTNAEIVNTDTLTS